MASDSDYSALTCTPESSRPSGRETATAWLYTPGALAFLLGLCVPACLSLACFFARARAARRRTRAVGTGRDHDGEVLLPSSAERCEECQDGYADCASGWVHLTLLAAVSVALLLLQALLVPQVVSGRLTCATEELQRRRLALFNASGLFTTVWFCALANAWPTLRNSFRAPCSLAEASVVQVTLTQRDAAAGADGGVHTLSLVCPVSREGGAATLTVLGERRVYDASAHRFLPPACPWHAPPLPALHAHAAGLSDAQAARTLSLLGANTVEVPVPPLLSALASEFLQTFYVYQFACVSLWAVDHYAAYAYALLVSILVAGVANVLLLRRTQLQLRAMAAHEAPVRVCRGGEWRCVSSAALVPGDLVQVSEGPAPCDAALVCGRPVVDECSLTGESLPVTKTPVPDAPPEMRFQAERHRRHALFAGTRVLKAAEAAAPSLCVVTATGMSTSKGLLVRTLMHPRPLRLHYEAQARIILLALFLYGLATFAVTVFDFRTASAATSIVFGLESLATVIPPLLPLALAVGQAVAADRLRRKRVHCLSLPRIALAGMVDVFCFDKTGTLTREGLDFAGATPVQGATFAGAVTHVAALPERTRAGMAACTSLSRLGNTLVGTEVDRKLFQTAGWQLGEDGNMRSPCDAHALTLLRRFDFDHALQSMAVVVRDEGGATHVFAKGSYERMKSICSPETLPPDYDAEAATLARQGGYVLALGHRALGEQEALCASQGTLSRAQAEQGLRLLCLLTFRNELKEDTAAALSALRLGGIPAVMITGDNAFTGARVARDCGLLRADAPIAYSDSAAHCSGSLLAWRDIDSGVAIDESAIMAQLGGFGGAAAGGAWCELALSGDAFALAIAAPGSEARSLVLHARILARMSPEQKSAAVEAFKAAGSVVGMCGDGGNDCGALRCAHVGLALSDAEASLVAPFASGRRSLGAVVDLLLEGRASLATSFASLKYMAMYGLLYSVLNLLVNAFRGSLTQGQYLLIDMAIILPLSAVSTLGGPARVLTLRRPPTSLLGAATLLSLLGQFALCASFQAAALALLSAQRWYVRTEERLADPSRWWLAADRQEVTVLFLASIHAFAASAVAFSLGSRFRAPAHQNWAQNAAFTALQTVFAVLTLSDAGWLGRALHLTPLPPRFRVQLWLLLQLQTAALLGWEKALLDGPVADWARTWGARSHQRPSFLRLSGDQVPTPGGSDDAGGGLELVTAHTPPADDTVPLLPPGTHT